MNGLRPTSQEQKFLQVLENIEARQVANGDFESFVELKEICQEINLDPSRGLELARGLARQRLLLLDCSTGNELVKSKVSDIIKSLFYTTTLVRNRLARDVSDLKYLRFMKQIPKLTIPLAGKETRETIINDLIESEKVKKHGGYIYPHVTSNVLYELVGYKKIHSYKFSKKEK